MIGETIKIGFNGSEVTKGIGGINRGFRSLASGVGRVTRQIGIGAARHIGASLTGLAISLVRAIPDELSALSDLNQEFFAMGDATGVASRNLLALRQALAKTSNVSPNVSSKMLKELTGRIGEAQEYGSMAFQAMNKLGIRPDLIKGKNVIDQLKQISEGYQRLRDSAGIEVAADTMKDLLGGRLAKDVTPLLLNFSSAMDDARAKTKGLADDLENAASELDAIDDVKIAMSNKMSEVALGALKQFNAVGGSIKGIAEFIEGIDVSKTTSQVAAFISDSLKAIQNDGLIEWLKAKMAQLGEYLSEIIANAIRQGISDALPSIPFFGGGSKGSSTPSFFSGLMGAKSASNLDEKMTKDIARNTEKTAMVLEKISFNGVAAVYA